jgi:VWFA-related protein
MNRLLVRTSVGCLVLGLTLSLPAQKPVELKGNPTPATEQNDQDPALSLKSFSRMVLVDVVVKDSNGKPVPGLKADDFELLEDGQPQKIISFAHDSAPPQSAINADPGDASDFVTNQKDKALAPPAMIVLDLLNTAPADRMSAREALAKFVQQKMRRGETVALFVLGHKLELLQDFSRDPQAVAAAVAGSQRALGAPEIRREAAQAAYTSSDMGGEDALSAKMADLARAISQNEKEVQAHRAISRVNDTLAAMRSLARFGARHPGRKSLVWLSSGFPFYLFTDMGLTGFETELRQTSNLLASAQVAVYPVDARGLAVIGERDPQDRARTINMVDPKEKVYRLSTESISSESRGRSRLTENSYLEAAFDFNQSQDTMKEVADLTGGTAYMNRNDIDVAIAQALDDNRDTYTLGYYPLKKDFNNRFRRIKVRLKNREASLRYRKGYYATGFSVESKVSTDLISALENDPTVSPQIPLISRVNPNAPLANTPFKVELFVKGGHIHYTDVSAKSAAFLDFAVVALSPNGTPIARTFRRGELKFNKDGLARAERAGFTYSLPVNLPAGEYRLRAGVRDSFTGRIGTVEIPVVVK